MAVFAKPQNDVFALFLLQVIVILVAVRVLGALLAKIKQPRVIGEVIAGLVLGPTVLGNIDAFRENVFPTYSLSYLTLISNIGLIFFMFLLGMEVDQKLLAATFKTSIVVSLGSSACSFFVGIGLGAWLYNEKLDPIPIPEHYGGFCLFVGTAISFAAFPILARILTGLGLQRTPMGIKILSCAALDDILGWTTVALVLGYFNGGGVQKGIYTALITAAFVAVVTVVCRYGLTRIAPKSGAANKQFIAIVFLLLLVCALICEILHVHAFFGAFVFGILVPREGNWVQKLIPKLELIVVDFFLPLYFAKLGLRTELNALDNPKVWLITLVLVLAASVAKLVPVLLLSRLFGNDWRTALTFGVLMNTRGLVALIVVGIAADLDIIGQQVFAMLVLLALITTVITAPILYLLYLKPALDTLPEDEAREKMEQLVPGSTSPPTTSAAAATSEAEEGGKKKGAPLASDASLAVPLLDEPQAEPVVKPGPETGAAREYRAPQPVASETSAKQEAAPAAKAEATVVDVVESGPNETPLAPEAAGGSESEGEA